MKKISNQSNSQNFKLGIKKVDANIPKWPEKNFILLSGTEGSGKLIFSMQFLVNGIKFFDEPGLYISLEDDENEILYLLNTFSWDLQNLIQKKKLEIIKPETISMQTIIKYIEDEKDRLNIKRIVINPLNLISSNSKDIFSIRKNLSDLKRKIFNLNCHCLLVSDVNNEQKSYSYSGYEEFVANSHLHLSIDFDRKKNKAKRYIEILK
ncbi:MAG: ATPase domain-containing protein, partial [Candidatus Anstonellales archaeon]